MAMVNLKRKKKKTEDKVQAVSSPREEYSYNLRISLETEELRKLGKTVNNFQIGAKIGFAAEGEIRELVKREKTEYDSQERVEIQIMDIDLGTTPKPSKFQQFQKEDNKGPGE